MTKDRWLTIYRTSRLLKNLARGGTVAHHARIATYVDIKKTGAKLVSFLTNNVEIEPKDIVDIDRKRWEIELLFKQMKQNFPLRYFYGEKC